MVIGFGEVGFIVVGATVVGLMVIGFGEVGFIVVGATVVGLMVIGFVDVGFIVVGANCAHVICFSLFKQKIAMAMAALKNFMVALKCVGDKEEQNCMSW
jgi:hypothetical protein